jgi:pimeloyl-ACP methyl ester carboxylesterase
VIRPPTRGLLVAAGVLGATAAAVVTGRRWWAAEDPSAGTMLDLDGAEVFKVERPDGGVLDGVIVGSGPPVVLSHCWTGSRATWEPVAAHLVATRDAFLSLPTDVRRQFLIALQAMDFRAGLASVAVPTTVVVGRRDRLTPPRLGRALAAAIPGARLVEVPGAGHMLPYEEPDRLADIILSAPGGTGGVPPTTAAVAATERATGGAS